MGVWGSIYVQSEHVGPRIVANGIEVEFASRDVVQIDFCRQDTLAATQGGLQAFRQVEE